MRTSTALAALGLLLVAQAHAAPADATKLAQFDVGFTQCEALFPEMRGHADEAYLSLWKVTADEKARTQLATLRKSGPYQKARQAALKSPPKKSTELDARVKQQCETTWAEARRNAAPAAKR